MTPQEKRAHEYAKKASLCPGEFDARLESYLQAEKDSIERACEWLFSHLPILIDYYNEDIHEKADRSEFIKLFRTQMEEE